MNPTALLVVYCVLVVLASVAGGLAPLVIRMTHRRLQGVISLTTGFMFGVAVLLMLPHALEVVPTQNVMYCLLAGFLLMFFVERFLGFHTHEVAELDVAGRVVWRTSGSFAAGRSADIPRASRAGRPTHPKFGDASDQRPPRVAPGRPLLRRRHGGRPGCVQLH